MDHARQPRARGAVEPADELGKTEPVSDSLAPAGAGRGVFEAWRRRAPSLAAWWLGLGLLAALGLFLVSARLPGPAAAAQAHGFQDAAGRLTRSMAESGPGAFAALRDELHRRTQEARQLAEKWRFVVPDLEILDSRLRALPPNPTAQALGPVTASADRAAMALVTRLEDRHAQVLLWLQGLALLLSVLLLVPLNLMWRQRRRVRRSVQRAGHRLVHGDWHGAASTLRDDRLGAPSAFDALATGVEDVIGEAERRWRALAELSADWYWESDARHRVTWTAGDGPDVMGRRRDENGRLEAPVGGWEAFHARLGRREAFRHVEMRVRPAAGETARWVSVSGRPRHDAHGAFVGYEGVGHDITERRQAHDRLAASEQRWSAIAGLASDWYWETDEQHRLLPLAAEFNGRFPQVVERAVGQTRWDAYPNALPAAEWVAHRAALDARRPFRSLKLEVDVGRGHRLWLSVSGLPRFDAQGRFVGYHGVGRDITVRKHAERLLERHNQELQRAVAGRTRELQQLNRDLDAFSRQLAHELRTPIGHVEGLAQLLEARAVGRLGEDERQLIGLQVQAAQGMRQTVDALMQLARSAVQPMPMEPVDVSQLAAQVLAELPALERRAPVEWHIEPEMRALASPAALRIVLSNLMGNAAKFTRQIEHPRVRIGARHDPDGRLRVTVQDNGAGFDAAHAGRLFVPFSRLHGGEDFQGTGIGLSIVQRIVERHGGSVAAHGEPGLGARFEFTLAPPEDAAGPH